MNKDTFYLLYTPKDFVRDDSFQQWALHESSADQAFWEAFRQTYPHKRADIDAALRLVQSLRANLDDRATDQEKAQVWANITQAIHAGQPAQQPGSDQSVNRQPVFSRTWWTTSRRVVAGIAGIGVLLGLMWFWVQAQPQVYETAFGERRTVLLPDGSQVVLNANSTLDVPRDWEGKKVREVWLRGEAFFSVVRKPDSVRFLVHTPTLTVEALGTKFNVYDRRGTSTVALTEGKVRVSAAAANTPREQVVYLRPNEVASVDRTTKATVKEDRKAVDLAAWQTNTLNFENTTLAEISATIQDYYGVTVRFANPDDATRRFTGTLPNNDLEVILQSVSKLYGLTVQRTDEGVILQ